MILELVLLLLLMLVQVEGCSLAVTQTATVTAVAVPRSHATHGGTVMSPERRGSSRVSRLLLDIKSRRRNSSQRWVKVAVALKAHGPSVRESAMKNIPIISTSDCRRCCCGSRSCGGRASVIRHGGGALVTAVPSVVDIAVADVVNVVSVKCH